MIRCVLFRFAIIIVVINLFIPSCSKWEGENSDIPRDAVMETPVSKNNTKLLTLKSGVEVEFLPSGEYIYQGDVILSEKQLDLLDRTGSIIPDVDPQEMGDYGMPVLPQTGMIAHMSDSGLRAVGRSPHQGMFWSMVRYTLNPSLRPYEKDVIRRAIRTIESKTNARFYDATGKPTRDATYKFDYPYVEFMPSDSINASNIGRIGGRQVIHINSFVEYVVIHEICHALGMFHEQCRNDRDNYITVHYNNIKAKKESNFRVESKDYSRIGVFDFKSIMLYDSYAFSANGKPTMTKKDGSTFDQGTSLSEQDRMFINRFYIPYVAREDVCVELDSVMYDANNKILSDEERLRIQSALNVRRCQKMVDPKYYYPGGSFY